VTVLTALILRNYWALVAGILTGRLLGVALSYTMHPYRPRLTLRAWRELAGFSFWTWALSIAGIARDRSDTFVIGRMLGASQVGIYEVGMEIATLPNTELVWPLARATFPSFAAARHSGVSTDQTYLRIVSLMALLTLPLGVGISLVADPLVRFALGTSWLGAIAVIQILSFVGIVAVFGHISATLFSAYGLLKTMFLIALGSMLCRTLLLTGFVMKLGLVGAAAAATLCILGEHLTYIVLTMRRFGLRPSVLLLHTWRSLLATAVMAATLVLTGLGWSSQSAADRPLVEVLCLAVALGALVYMSALGAAWLVAGRPAGAETDLLAFARRLLSEIASVFRRFRLVRQASTAD